MKLMATATLTAMIGCHSSAPVQVAAEAAVVGAELDKCKEEAKALDAGKEAGLAAYDECAAKVKAEHGGK